MITLAIVIPYYQKRAGILRRALTSVLEQQIPLDTHVHIIVVDDASPVPSQTEIEGLTFAPPFHLVIKKQPNGGVGAARNTALGQTSDQTDYISFLDSDDIWQRGFLFDAVTTLERGYDFYFCDAHRLKNPKHAFDEGDFSQFLSSPNAKKIGENSFELEKEAFFDQSLRRRVFQTSSVVYRRSVAPDHAFDTSLLIAGEDCLFFLQLIGKCRKFACSTQLLVLLADGINIYASRHGWDNPAYLELCMAQLIAFDKRLKGLSLSTENISFLKNRIKKIRQLFAFLTIRYFLKFRKAWPPELVKLTQQDATFRRWYPVCLLYVSLGRVFSFYDPLEEW